MYLLGVEYSDRQLARTLIRGLWHIYDSGGVSCGRSLRATLIEEVIRLWESDNFPTVETISAILEDVQSHARQMTLQHLLFVDLKLLSDVELIRLLLAKLHEWYENDAILHDEPLGFYEFSIMHSICELLHIDARAQKFFRQNLKYSIEDLIEETKRRYRLKMDFRMNLLEF